MAEKKLICIGCPMGCALRVELDENGRVLSVSGNTCKRGEEYGRREVTAPARTVTSTVLVEGGEEPVVPVRTQREVPKEKIFACMEAIRQVRARAPVRLGEVLLEDVAGTGVPLIATKEITAGK